MNDDASDIEWLRRQIAKAGRHADAVSDDISEQDGLRLTGTVMRLDRVRESLEEAWHTLQLVYDAALERDRALYANGTVSEPSDGGAGVVADVLRAASTGIRERRSVVDAGGYRSEDVA
jgi:hypothetical protein